jgi:hypothetical protein
MNIQDGTYADIETLLPLAKEMHETSIYKDTHYDENVVREFASKFCGNPHKYFRVYKKNGLYPMGYLLGYITNYLWGNDLLAQEELLFTDQSSQLAGFKLLKDFEKWAKEKGCKEVNYSVTYGGSPTSQYDRVMERMGYTKQGAIYKKGIL